MRLVEIWQRVCRQIDEERDERVRHAELLVIRNMAVAAFLATVALAAGLMVLPVTQEQKAVGLTVLPVVAIAAAALAGIFSRRARHAETARLRRARTVQTMFWWPLAAVVYAGLQVAGGGQTGIGLLAGVAAFVAVGVVFLGISYRRASRAVGREEES